MEEQLTLQQRQAIGALVTHISNLGKWPDEIQDFFEDFDLVFSESAIEEHKDYISKLPTKVKRAIIVRLFGAWDVCRDKQTLHITIAILMELHMCTVEEFYAVNAACNLIEAFAGDYSAVNLGCTDYSPFLTVYMHNERDEIKTLTIDLWDNTIQIQIDGDTLNTKYPFYGRPSDNEIRPLIERLDVNHFPECHPVIWKNMSANYITSSIEGTFVLTIEY